jgi:hypothetical protein
VSDTDYFDRVRAAVEPSWADHEREKIPDETTGAVPVEPTAEADEWEPLEPLTLDERLANVEAYLAPRAVEQQRDEQLERMQRQADEAFEMEPRELAIHAAEAARLRTMDELGVTPRPATMEDTLAAGEEIAAAHIENWAEIRESVFDEMQARPQWLYEVEANPSPAALGQAFVSVASVLAQAHTAQEQQAATRREAQTMGGASSRPATQTADEEYWDRIRAAGTGGYGS